MGFIDDDGKSEEEVLRELSRRYLAAVHAMQTGVAWMQGLDGGETEPKHLRVGINSAHSSINALGELLMAKGLITQLEYVTAVTEAAEREVEDYRQKLKAMMDKKNGGDISITLV